VDLGVPVLRSGQPGVRQDVGVARHREERLTDAIPRRAANG
jgi:hypothetical protein